MPTRSTRKQPFCWQEKKVLRLLRSKFKKAELSKYRNLYLTLTEIDSDFNHEPIKYYTKTIATYSGLARDWIPSALRRLEEFNVIEIIANRKDGKFSGDEIIFTPERVQEVPQKAVAGKTVNGKTNDGDPAHKKIISFKEDSSYSEEEKIAPNGAPPVSVTKNGKTKQDPNEPMDIDAFISWCRASPQVHMQIIAEWADQLRQSKPGWVGFKTRGAWDNFFIQPNLRAANKLKVLWVSESGKDKISAAMDLIEKAHDNGNGYLEDFTKLATLCNYIPKVAGV